MRPILQGIDWNDLANRSKAHDTCCRWLDALVAFRGIVKLDDAYDELQKAADGPVDLQTLDARIVSGVGEDQLGFRSFVLGEGDSTREPEVWIGYAPLVESCYTDEGIGTDYLDDLADLQADFVARPLPKGVSSMEGALSWICSTPSGAALLHYLDEHVPEGADDQMFSLGLIDEAVRCVQMDAGHIDSFLRRLDREDPNLSERELRKLLALVGAFAYDVPRWDLNGWSEADCLVADFALGEQGVRPQPRNNSLAEVIPFSPTVHDDTADTYVDVDPDTLIEQNNQFISEFEEWLDAKGLTDHTINRHLSNVDFFLNRYLAPYESVDIQEGVHYISSFLGNFFIRKAMWSTPATIRQGAASIKKFYQCMADKGHLAQEDAKLVATIVKEGVDEWCELCSEYNDPYGSNPFDPFGF